MFCICQYGTFYYGGSDFPHNNTLYNPIVHGNLGRGLLFYNMHRNVIHEEET